jgi:hypothetical protein
MHLVPVGAVAQLVQVCPGSPQVPSPMPAHIPRLQHPVWHVPSAGPPHAPVQLPPVHVGVSPPQGWQALPQWPLSKGTQLDPLQQAPAGQSLEFVQPQVPLRQCAPCEDSMQSTQPPGGPQLVDVPRQELASGNSGTSGLES